MIGGYSLRNLAVLFSLLCCSVFSFGQEIQFFDVQGNRIDKTKFERQLDNRVNLALSFQKGKITETRLLTRRMTGILSQDTLKVILSNLKELEANKVNHAKMIIINYHQGNDACNTSGSTDPLQYAMWINHYKDQVARLPNTSQFFISATKDVPERSKGVIEWYIDKSTFIEKSFFKFQYPCGSFVIIKPDGKYLAYFGEYAKDMLIKEAKKLLGN